MTTITLNERTQAGKTLFELAQKLAVKNKSITIKSTNFETKKLSPKQEKWVNDLKRIAVDVEAGNYKGQSLESFLDEI